MVRRQPDEAAQDGVWNAVHGDAHAVVQAGVINGDVNVNQAAKVKRLNLEVSCESTDIEMMLNYVDLVYPWVESERTRLLALADEYDWSLNERSSDWLHHRHMVRSGQFRDLRSREVYVSHVEDYLMEASEVLEQRALLLLEDHEPACVQLIVANTTDSHFRDIELGMWFEGAVRGFSDDLRYSLPMTWPDLPPIPAPPGTHGDAFEHKKVMSGPKRIIPSTRAEAAGEGQNVLDGWSGEDLQQGIQVTFDHFSLRPRQEYVLPLVPLKVLTTPGETLVGAWSATADDADGECSGKLVLAARPSTVNLDEATEPGPPTENNLSPLDVLSAVTPLLIQMRKQLPHSSTDAS